MAATKTTKKKTTKKTELREIAEREQVEQKCKDCGTEYQAWHVLYTDGHEITTPPRCEACQSRYLANIRMTKAIKDIRLLGNLKLRLSKKQKAMIVAKLSTEVNSVHDKFSADGPAKEAITFDVGDAE